MLFFNISKTVLVMVTKAQRNFFLFLSIISIIFTFWWIKIFQDGEIDKMNVFWAVSLSSIVSGFMSYWNFQIIRSKNFYVSSMKDRKYPTDVDSWNAAQKYIFFIFIAFFCLPLAFSLFVSFIF